MIARARSHWRAAAYAGLAMILLVIANCNGGGGGGGSTGATGLEGTYRGMGNVTVSGPGISIPVSGTVEFVVSDSTVTWTDGGTIASGTLDGNTFSISVPGSEFNSAGVSCTGSVIVNGTIDGPTMSGNFTNGGLRCNNVPVSVTGTFTATIQTQVLRGRPGGGMLEALRNALRSR
ncbi:MAG TPA: hypothetical protein VLD61_06595 [Methylomirabilota bacterium]|nr:hypothetical protein [Methylomirabilota bacterium]